MSLRGATLDFDHEKYLRLRGSDSKHRGVAMIHRLMRHGGIVALAATTMLMAVPTYADSAADLAQARTDLLGRGTRDWIKVRVVVSMGGDRHCSSGETYSFHSNGVVDIAACTNHVLVTRNVPWTLTAVPPLDVNLKFDGRSYQLSFSGTARAPQMRWRRLGQIKPDPTTDIYLGLSKD